MNGQAISPIRAGIEHDARVAEINRKYEELKSFYEEKCDDFSNEVESRRMWQAKARTSEAALTEHRQFSVSRTSTHAFAFHTDLA